MKSKLIALALSTTCVAALAITLSVSAAEQPPEAPATPPATSEQYSEYRNDQWDFAINVPRNIKVEKTDARGGATIQFLAPAGDILFQVSAWPYQDLDI